jgi:hypothetical protein
MTGTCSSFGHAMRPTALCNAPRNCPRLGTPAASLLSFCGENSIDLFGFFPSWRMDSSSSAARLPLLQPAASRARGSLVADRSKDGRPQIHKLRKIRGGWENVRGSRGRFSANRALGAGRDVATKPHALPTGICTICSLPIVWIVSLPLSRRAENLLPQASKPMARWDHDWSSLAACPPVVSIKNCRC